MSCLEFKAANVYVPPALRQGGGAGRGNAAGGQPRQNYNGRYSYAQQPQQPPQQPQGFLPPQQRGGHRQQYAGRFSYDQRNTHNEQEWQNQA